MPNPTIMEMVEILRRIGERGRAHALEQESFGYTGDWSSQVDLWQHLLDEVKRVKDLVGKD